MLNKIQKWAEKYMKSREPDFVIGGSDDPYLLRWWVIPRNRFFNIYLHKVLHSDDDRALHDHPFCNVSFIVKGGYDEYTIADGGVGHRARRLAGAFKFRLPSAAHRLEIVPELGETITLFVTGPRVRQWGFHCPQGWKHWKEFTSPNNKGEAGAGCGET